MLEADRWAEAHADLLALCFDYFQAGGGWPSLDLLQADFADEGREEDAGVVAKSIPPLLGMVEGGCLKLNVRGLSKVPAARQMLEIWAGLLREACEDPRRTINGAMVAAACEGNSVRHGCLAVILMQEPWPTPEGQGIIGGEWMVYLSEEVLAVREAETVEDALQARGLIDSQPEPLAELF